jgi:hypothetical protein
MRLNNTVKNITSIIMNSRAGLTLALAALFSAGCVNNIYIYPYIEDDLSCPGMAPEQEWEPRTPPGYKGDPDNMPRVPEQELPGDEPNAIYTVITDSSQIALDPNPKLIASTKQGSFTNSDGQRFDVLF